MVGQGEEEGFARLFDGLRIAGLDPLDSFNWNPERPPFPGFLFFDEDDAGIYFGRDGRNPPGDREADPVAAARRTALAVVGRFVGKWQVVARTGGRIAAIE